MERTFLIFRPGWLRILMAEEGTFLPKRGQIRKLEIHSQPHPAE